MNMFSLLLAPLDFFCLFYSIFRDVYVLHPLISSRNTSESLIPQNSTFGFAGICFLSFRNILSPCICLCLFKWWQDYLL